MGSVKSLCCVCAAEMGQAPGKGSTAERQSIFPKHYLELLGSTKSTLGLIGIKQVLTNHGSALIPSGLVQFIRKVFSSSYGEIFQRASKKYPFLF